ncbi:MAG: hypothetical protein IKP73_06380 [Bacteroidales bacterium]|nr:hypothetical protein [Bacteroidales bacterium]
MKTILTIILAVLFAANSFAQTAYQQKCNQIFVKYMKMIAASTGSKWGTAEQIALGNSGYSEAGAEILKPFLMAYCANTGKSYNAVCKQLDAEYAAARKLMTADEKFAMKVYTESKITYGKVKWKAREDFAEWMEKDEFENSEQLENRLREQSKAMFDEICYTNIADEIYENYWDVSFEDYDADQEELTLKFANRDNYVIRRSIGIKVEDAMVLKQKSSKCEPKLYADGLIQEVQNDIDPDYYRMLPPQERKVVFSFEYDTYELCALAEKVFVPRYFYIRSVYGDWDFDLTEQDNISLVRFNADEMRLDNPHLKGHIFDSKIYGEYLEAKNIEQEAQRKAEAARLAAQKAREDSVAIVNYNRQLLHTVDSLNQRLAANKYNINHLAVSTDFERIAENDQRLFWRRNDELISDFHKYERQINEDYDAARKEYGKLYAADEDFDKYYCQGLERLAVQTEYRSAMLQLQQNKNSIAQVNFQKDISNNNILNIISDQPVDYTDANEYRRKLLAWVAQYKSQPYYDEIVDFLITNNAALSKEFTKNGTKFSSKAEFYEAFTSGDYKAVLKGKK